MLSRGCRSPPGLPMQGLRTDACYEDEVYQSPQWQTPTIRRRSRTMIWKSNSQKPRPRLTEEQDGLDTMNRALRPDRPVDDAVMERRYRYTISIALLGIERRGLQRRLLSRRGVNRPAQATNRELDEDLTERMTYLEARMQLRIHMASMEGRPMTSRENRRQAANQDEFLNCRQWREEVRRHLS